MEMYLVLVAAGLGLALIVVLIVVILLKREKPRESLLTSPSEEVDAVAAAVPTPELVAAKVPPSDSTLTTAPVAGHANEDQLRGIVERMSDVIVLVDESGTILYVTPSVQTVLGFEPGEVVGRNASEFGSREAASQAVKHIPSLITGQVIESVALTLRRKDGSEAIIEWSGMPMLRGGVVVGFQLVGRDTTKRKMSEGGSTQLSTAIEQAGEIVLITDAEGTIQYVNPALEMVTGYTAAEAIGQTPRIWKSEKHDKEFYQAVWETISSGKVWAGTFINKKRDGTFYHEDTENESPLTTEYTEE